jgi:hypothetical protein
MVVWIICTRTLKRDSTPNISDYMNDLRPFFSDIVFRERYFTQIQTETIPANAVEVTGFTQRTFDTIETARGQLYDTYVHLSTNELRKAHKEYSSLHKMLLKAFKPLEDIFGKSSEEVFLISNPKPLGKSKAVELSEDYEPLHDFDEEKDHSYLPSRTASDKTADNEGVQGKKRKSEEEHTSRRSRSLPEMGSSTAERSGMARCTRSHTQANTPFYELNQVEGRRKRR